MREIASYRPGRRRDALGEVLEGREEWSDGESDPDNLAKRKRKEEENGMEEDYTCLHV